MVGCRDYGGLARRPLWWWIWGATWGFASTAGVFIVWTVPVCFALHFLSVKQRWGVARCTEAFHVVCLRLVYLW